MDRPLRDAIQSATQAARAALSEDYADQLQGEFDILPNGTIAAEPGAHLDVSRRALRRKLVAAVERRVETARNRAEGVAAYVREAAFTTLNRFVALKMLEVRGLVRESVTGGELSKGFDEFTKLAEGLKDLPDKGYRLYIESVCDEVAREVRVLFDRTDPASLLWPKRATLLHLFDLLNANELRPVWEEPETIGWVYQYFNDGDERRRRRKESSAPRDSYELALRNQFFTPRYVVEFLVDNTLGRSWWEMRPGRTALAEACRYMVRTPDEPPAKRHPKDPRELRVLDPACGSGHFLLYAFELLETIYEEAWLDPDLGPPLWREAGWASAPERPREVVVGEVQLDPALPPHCASCGTRTTVAEASVVIPVVPEGARFFVYCPRCAQVHAPGGDSGFPLPAPGGPTASQGHRRIPLVEFDYPAALREGWIRPDIGPMCLAVSRAFRFQAEVPEAREALPLLHRARPGWILAHNLHGVDIDARAAQIAALALWMRAQKALNDVAKPRPRIEQTNIVVAEPIPGDPAMRAEVEAKLPEALRPIFGKVIDELALAGDAGTLLRVERAIGDAVEAARTKLGGMPRQMTLGSWQKQQELLTEAKVWENAERSILAALREYAAGATGAAGLRRRMFQHDAAQGLAFVEVCQKKYDVVLMNPPFGAASLPAKDFIDRTYIEGKNDLFAAFVSRGADMLAPGGMVGALTNRTAFYNIHLEDWRRSFYGSQTTLRVFADLGEGVLDDALVEAAAYVIGRTIGELPRRCTVIRSTESVGRGRALQRRAADTRHPQRWEVSLSDVANLPGAALVYDIPGDLAAAFSNHPPVGEAFAVTKGLSTDDDFRFARFWWEVDPAGIDSRTWAWFAKGGSYSPFIYDVTLVVRWGPGGEEMAASAEARDANVARTRQSSTYYFRAGVAFPYRTSRPLSARPLPSNCTFSGKTVACFPRRSVQEVELLALAGYLNSGAGGTLAAAFNPATDAAARSYESSTVASFPLPQALTNDLGSTLAESVLVAWRQARSSLSATEPSIYFVAPKLEYDANVARGDVYERIDRIVARALGVAEIRSPHADAQSVGASQDEDDEEEQAAATGPSAWAANLLAWTVGVAFGRFDVRFGTAEREIPPEQGPFDPLPSRSPGMCSDDTLAVDVLVDDEGHPDDLVQRVAEVFTQVYGAEGDARLQQAVHALADSDTRGWVRRSFFDLHLKRYSKPRRKAPIWWPLSTTSGTYTLWVSWPRLTADTLFRLVSDQEPYVAQKIGQESRKLTSMKQDAGKAPTRAQSVAIGAQEDFVSELTGLRDELAMVAPMWRPVHDDGVVLHAALLWRVFRNAGWQKECRERWEGLAGEKYEWAHIAMHLWPERVVPKCRKDRSLAIAHGLEGLFWIEDAGRWRPRETPDAEVRLAGEALDFVWFRTAFRKLRAYADAHAAEPRWWSDLRDGLHDDEDVALALWPERVMKRCQEDERVAMCHQMVGLYRRKFTDRVKTGKRTWADELRDRRPHEMDALTLAFDEAAARFGSVGARDWPAFWRALDAGDLDDTTLARLVRPAEVAAHSREDAHIARIHGLLDRFWIDGRKRRTPEEETADAIRERSSLAVKDALRAFEQAPPPVRSGRGRKGSA